MGTLKGLFHHRASLAWEWEETRFRGWRAFTPHHANRPPATELTCAGAHTHHVRYHHDSRPTATDWRGTRARWEARRGCSTTGPHLHGSGMRPGFVAGVRSHRTTPTGLQSRLIDAARHTPTTSATTTTAGLQSRLTGVARARGGNPRGALQPPGLTRMGVGGDPASWLACAHATPRQQGPRAD